MSDVRFELDCGRTMAANPPPTKPTGVPRWLQIVAVVVSVCGGLFLLVTNGRTYFGVHDVQITPSFVAENMFASPPTLTFSVSNLGTRQAVLQSAYIASWSDAVAVTRMGTGNGAWLHRLDWGKEFETASGIPLSLQPGDTRIIRLLVPEVLTNAPTCDIGLDVTISSDAKTYDVQYPLGVVSHPNAQTHLWGRIDHFTGETRQLLTNAFVRPPGK